MTSGQLLVMKHCSLVVSRNTLVSAKGLITGRSA